MKLNFELIKFKKNNLKFGGKKEKIKFLVHNQIEGYHWLSQKLLAFKIKLLLLL